MNESEFDNVRRRLGAMFPSLIDWFGALDGKSAEGVPVTTQARRNSMRARWRAALEDTHVDDAMAAIDDIAKRPDDPWPFPADKERAGAIVAHEARRLASARREAEQTNRLRTARRRQPVDVGSIRSNVIERIESDPRHNDECRQHRAAKGRCRPGCPVPSLVAAEINAEPCDLPSDREIYRCVLCRDTGLVSVLSGELIRETAETGCARPWARQGLSLACSCDGQAARNYRESKLPSGELAYSRFDGARHVPADLPPAALVAACRAVVESLGGRRVASFDHWNQRNVTVFERCSI